jgi:hypothetical protein
MGGTTAPWDMRRAAAHHHTRAAVMREVAVPSDL